VSRIDGQVTHSESRLHDYDDSLLNAVFKARELYHAEALESTHLQGCFRPNW
jgi:hypothetical protein